MLSKMLKAAAGQGTTPATPTDANFNQVSLLLHGDGTNGAQNNTFIGEVNPAQYYGTFSSGSWLVTPSSSNLALNTGDLTWELYTYVPASGAYQTFIDSRTGSGNAGFFLGLNTGTLIPIVFNDSTLIITSSISLVASTWNHIALVRNSGTLVLYVNGVSGGSVANTANLTSTTYGIGTYAPSSGNQLNGRISNLRVVKGTAVYTSVFTPPTGNLTAITGTQLLTLQNSTVVDNSTNNFTLTNTGPVTMTDQYPTVTRNGNTTQGTNTPFSQAAGYWSSNFNGTSDYLSSPLDSVNIRTTAFTIESWCNIATATNFILFAGSVTTTTGQSLYLQELSGTVYFGDGTANPITFSSSLLPLNSWFHCAISFDGTTYKIFINGTSVGSTTTLLSNFVLLSTFIGARTTGTSVFLKGYISNFRIVKGTAVYTSNFTPPTIPLTAISGTSLLTCQSNYFKDNSSNNFALTATGTPSVQPFSPFAPTSAYSTSVNGGSLISNAAANYLSIPSTSTLAFGTGDFTIEYWAYTNVSGQYQQCFYNGSTGGMQLYLNPSQQFTYSHSGVGELIISTIAVNLNTWNHVAVSRSSGTTKTFVNGVQAGTLADTTNWTNTTYKILSEGASPTYGYISNFRVVKGTALYTSNFTPPTAPLTAITNTSLLLSGTNAGIYDNAIKNDLETVGNAQVSTSVVKYGTGSMKFNGTTDYLTLPSTPNLAMGSGNFTWELWVYVNSFSTFQAFIDSRTSTQGEGLYFGINFSSNAVVVYDNGGVAILTSSTTLTASTWTHIALVRNAGTLTLYFNGVSVGSVANTFNLSSTKYGIGVIISTLLYFLNGYIDDLRITKGIARYTANFTPPTQAFPNQ